VGAGSRHVRGIRAALAAVLCCALLAPAAQARRVAVTVVGDSVQEGYTVQDYAVVADRHPRRPAGWRGGDLAAPTAGPGPPDRQRPGRRRHNRRAFGRLHIDVTLILSGGVDEMTADYIGGGRWLRDFEGGLRVRARDARRTGRCAIVPPPPLPVAAAIKRAFARVERAIARQEGCTFAPVLEHVWASPGVSLAGRLTHEGIHPTRAGDARMARALVPVVEHIDGPRHVF
jgi:hypothetical protein